MNFNLFKLFSRKQSFVLKKKNCEKSLWVKKVSGEKVWSGMVGPGRILVDWEVRANQENLGVQKTTNTQPTI